MTDATAITVTVDGKEMSMDEINKLLEAQKSLNKQLAAVKKEAKSKGIKLVAEKAPKEKTAEYILLVANFLPTVEANEATIAKMFIDSRSDASDDTSGQDSISFNVTPEYQVIIRSTSVTKAKKEARDAKVQAEKEVAEARTLLATGFEKDGKTALTDARKAELTAKIPVEITLKHEPTA
jgi:hypothetical protein